MVPRSSRLSLWMLLMFQCRRISSERASSSVSNVKFRRRREHDRINGLAFVNSMNCFSMASPNTVPSTFAIASIRRNAPSSSSGTPESFRSYHGRCDGSKTLQRRPSSPSLCWSSRLWASSASNNDSGSHEQTVHATKHNLDNSTFFAPNVFDFATMGIQSPILLRRLQSNLKLERPSATQVAAFAALQSSNPQEIDVIIGAETGSGKTLSYLLPLMDDILQRKAAAGTGNANGEIGYDYARALILVPNKELVQQVVRMAVGLSGGRRSIVYGGSTLPDTSVLEDDSTPNTDEADPESMNDVVRIAIMPGGLKEPLDFVPFRQTKALSATGTQPPIDLIISTPAAVAPLGLSPKNIPMFADIQTVVMDEADLLLDGGYIRPLQDVLLGFKRADRLNPTLFRVVGSDDPSPLLPPPRTKTQHVFVAATLPDSGLRSVDAYLTKRFPYIQRIALNNMHMARHSGLRPEQATVWIEEESKKERMKEFVRMLSDDLQHEKVMVFLNSVEDVEASTQALQRVGVSCLPYHAKIPLDERTDTLHRFRQYQRNSGSQEELSDAVPVLVCTDLASRGLDIPGVTAVVQLQFAGNVVAHLHRMGRCGRAEQTTGRGIVFYSAKERALVSTVRAAESMQQQTESSSRLTLAGDVTDAALQELDEAADDESFQGDDGRVNQSERNHEIGKVTMSFSRKRGFTKKIKKDVKRQSEASSTSRNEHSSDNLDL